MFSFNFDNRMLYIILAVLALVSIVSLGTSGILSLLLTLPGVIIAITFHEFAHAYAADKLGDDTPRMQGRLNLNPLSHLDPIGFFMLLFVHIGWGKPVQINPRNFDRKVSMSAGEAIVSVAGPVMNFLLAIVFTIIYFFIGKYNPMFFFTSTMGNIIYLLLINTIFVNIGLGVFNLIPLPPLDGSKIFMHFMPYNARNWIWEHQQVFYFVFLVLWITGSASVIISPVIEVISDGIFWVVSKLFGFI